MQRLVQLIICFLIFNSVLEGQNQAVQIRQEISGGELIFYLRNPLPCPFRITIRPKSEMTGELTYEPGFILEPHTDRMEFYRMSARQFATDPSAAYNLFSYDIIPGDPATSIHEEGYDYLFPFSPQKAYQLTRGYRDLKGTGEQYLLEFEIHPGDTVCAAREGVVIRVIEDLESHQVHSGRQNHILIYHADGTFSDYSQISTGSSLVRPGDTVDRGSPLALAGSSKFRFAVRQAWENGFRNLPVVIGSMAARKLKTGRFYPPL